MDVRIYAHPLNLSNLGPIPLLQQKSRQESGHTITSLCCNDKWQTTAQPIKQQQVSTVMLLYQAAISPEIRSFADNFPPKVYCSGAYSQSIFSLLYCRAQVVKRDSTGHNKTNIFSITLSLQQTSSVTRRNN